MARALKCECGSCNVCKSRERMRRRQQEDPERARAIDRARYKRNKEARRAAHLAYLETAEGRAASNAAKRAWMERNPEKRKAHGVLNQAVRWGKLAKPDECELASANCHGRIEAHHDDYSKPLDVRWLCVYHHDEADRELQMAAAESA